MDPLFEAPPLQRFDPPVELDADRLCRECTVVVLSSSCSDRFSPRALARVSRSVPVLYPANDTLIRRALGALGFERPVPIAGDRPFAAGGLTLVPTPDVGLVRQGMLFIAAGRSFWNTADVEVDGPTLSKVRRRVGRPDLLFTGYQPSVDERLSSNGLGGDFPFRAYGRLLTTAWNINARYVAPGGCGLRYETPWLNDRAFPVTETRFQHDLAAVGTDLEVLALPPGGAVDVTRVLEVEPNGQPHVRRARGAGLQLQCDWRPERGVPPLEDPNPFGYELSRLEREVKVFVGETVLERLEQADVQWLEKLRRLKARWALEIVLPDGSTIARRLRFDRGPLRWELAVEGRFALRTLVPASVLLAALEGRVNAAAFSRATRKMQRLYSAHRSGLTDENDRLDDPLERVLLGDLDLRFLERELEPWAAPAGARHEPRSA